MDKFGMAFDSMSPIDPARRAALALELKRRAEEYAQELEEGIHPDINTLRDEYNRLREGEGPEFLAAYPTFKDWLYAQLIKKGGVL